MPMHIGTPYAKLTLSFSNSCSVIFRSVYNKTDLHHSKGFKVYLP